MIDFKNAMADTSWAVCYNGLEAFTMLVIYRVNEQCQTIPLALTFDKELLYLANTANGVSATRAIMY